VREALVCQFSICGLGIYRLGCSVADIGAARGLCATAGCRKNSEWVEGQEYGERYTGKCMYTVIQRIHAQPRNSIRLRRTMGAIIIQTSILTGCHGGYVRACSSTVLPTKRCAKFILGTTQAWLQVPKQLDGIVRQ
jgi:hypothetical protein